jgi:hypothetical protein
LGIGHWALGIGGSGKNLSEDDRSKLFALSFLPSIEEKLLGFHHSLQKPRSEHEQASSEDRENL